MVSRIFYKEKNKHMIEFLIAIVLTFIFYKKVKIKKSFLKIIFSLLFFILSLMISILIFHDNNSSNNNENSNVKVTQSKNKIPNAKEIKSYIDDLALKATRLQKAPTPGAGFHYCYKYYKTSTEFNIVYDMKRQNGEITNRDMKIAEDFIEVLSNPVNNLPQEVTDAITEVIASQEKFCSELDEISKDAVDSVREKNSR
jgi:hypothetical protein